MTYEPRTALRLKVIQKLLDADPDMGALKASNLADAVVKLFRTVDDVIESCQVAVKTPSKSTTRTVWQRHMAMTTWYEPIEWRPVRDSAERSDPSKSS